MRWTRTARRRTRRRLNWRAPIRGSRDDSCWAKEGGRSGSGGQSAAIGTLVPVACACAVPERGAQTALAHAPRNRAYSAPGGFCRDVELKERSEEHTSELQSQSNLVCRLLL